MEVLLDISSGQSENIHMNSKFWLERWEQNNIGFHKDVANPILIEHFSRLGLKPTQRLLIPLCGKSLDIGWSMSQGLHVVGAELSELAITQLFTELELKPQIKSAGDFKHYSAKQIDIFVGDFFSLSKKDVGHIDAIYDRAALIALPPDLRKKYAAHLMKITNCAPQLLLTYEYDQSKMPGPPFCVTRDEVKALYQSGYEINLLECVDQPKGTRDSGPAVETVWHLK